MAQPAPFERSTSFANYTAANPSRPHSGTSLDTEFNAIRTTLDQILQNLELIQRDDGALANESVGLDQLADEVEIGFNAPTAWAASTSYSTSPRSTVFYETQFYRCVESHISEATFDADKWELIADFSNIAIGAASQVACTPTGTLAASNVQAALAELDSEKSAVGHTHPAAGISDSTSYGRDLLTAVSVATQRAFLGLGEGQVRVGDWKYTDTLTLQSGWLWRDGTAKSRTTYAALFAAITISTTGNTTNGSAVISGIPSTVGMVAGMPVSGTNISGFAATISSVDSLTQITISANCTGTGTGVSILVAPHGVPDADNFYLPDGRGRIAVAADSSPVASPAGRVTTAGSSVNGVRVGASGGAQTVTLAQANLPNVTLTGTPQTASQALGHTTSGQAANVVNGSSLPTDIQDTGGGVNVYASNAYGTVDQHTVTFPSSDVPLGGSGAAVNKMPPVLVCNSVIYAGV